MNRKLNKVVFYLSPHPDDWQVFCGHEAAADMNSPQTKVVFIYITAGDSNHDAIWWQSREKAALLSTGDGEMSTEQVTLNGHLITKHIKKNSISYCLRLPDGLPNGEGSPPHGQSLKQLQEHVPLEALDGSTTYSSWEDLCTTLGAIISAENPLSPASVWIHSPEYSPFLNPNDHADHRATAEAARAISQQYNRVWWLTYTTYYLPSNLSPAEIEAKKNFFNLYSLEFERLTRTVANDLVWIYWGKKGYCRRVAASESDEVVAPHPDDRLSRSPHAREIKDEDGFRIVNEVTQKAIQLDTTAARVWTLLESPRTFDDLYAVLEELNPGHSILLILSPFLSAELIEIEPSSSSSRKKSPIWN